MTQISIERESDDKLTRETWRFFYDDRYHALRCSHYVHEDRNTTRHKYRQTEQSWDSYRRGSGRNPMTLPDDIQRDALRQFTCTLTVKPWDEN